MKIDTMLGLGEFGANICSKFKILGIFKDCFTISNDSEDFNIPKMESHEKYDELELNFDLSKVGEEVLFFVCGSEDISGVTLRFLELLKDKKVHILYYMKNPNFLSKTQILQHNVTFGVLQELARSGIFQSFGIVEELSILKMVEDVSIFNFSEKIYDFLVNSLGSIFRFYQQNEIFGQTPEFSEHYRIGTFGVLNVKTLEEFKFFEGLEGDLERHYFYAVPEEIGRNGKNVLGKIMDIFSQKLKEFSKVTFSIQPTKHNVEFCYVIYKTSNIQRIKK